MPSPSSAPEPSVGQQPRPPVRGTATISLDSPFQEPGTTLTLLTPGQHIRRIVIALPVEKGDGTKYGSSLHEIGGLNADLRQETLFAVPTFSQSPWLVNHAERREGRQEDHLIKVVLPALLAAAGKEHHPPMYLLGFSKGGFAALNLLTRHPNLFTAVTVWDASLLSHRPPHPQLVEVAGSSTRLSEYDVRSNLRRHAASLRGRRRIALGGIGTLEADWLAGQALLQELDIPHIGYRDAEAEHRWCTAWLAPAMRHLLALETGLRPPSPLTPR
ncbi:alpha/beta hydrolase-fold protein [Streptomyces sp. NPDC055089]